MGLHELHLAHAQAAEPRPLKADCRRALGITAVMRGDYASARANLEKALAIYRVTGDRQGESQILNDLGIAFGEQGNFVHRGGGISAPVDVR